MTKPKRAFSLVYLTAVLILTAGFAHYSFAQKPQAANIEPGSQTAKNGFRNETEIQGKFNNWKLDADARGWGHGVGMCQYGAYGLAKIGVKYDEIIRHYYTRRGTDEGVLNAESRIAAPKMPAFDRVT